MHGDSKAGLTVFWADEGLDTGPILLQKECEVQENDTVDSLYNRFLFPEGIKAMVRRRSLSCGLLRKGLECFGRLGQIVAYHTLSGISLWGSAEEWVSHGQRLPSTP